MIAPTTKDHYDQRPRNEFRGSFEDYERNRVLPEFFPEVDGTVEVLDVGAGEGLIACWLRSRGYRVTAMDFSEQAARSLEELDFPTIRRDVQDLPWPMEKECFDLVFWGDNVEHLFYPMAVAREIHRVLRPGGALAVEPHTFL